MTPPATPGDAVSLVHLYSDREVAANVGYAKKRIAQAVHDLDFWRREQLKRAKNPKRRRTPNE